MEQNICVTIIYPTDPLDFIPGGIDTFIRGIIKWAPTDISFEVVGVTTNSSIRPVGRWIECSLDGRSFLFFPTLAIRDSLKPMRIPLTLLFTISLFLKKPRFFGALLEFHRLEPMLPFINDPRPKTAFIHLDMADLKNPMSSVRWKHWPCLYYRIEHELIQRLSIVFAVRESVVRILRKQYPSMKKDIHFIPTWADPTIFYPLPKNDRQLARVSLRNKLGLPMDAILGVTIARLDSQKNPFLIIDALAQIANYYPKFYIVFVGDGALRPRLKKQIQRDGLMDRALLLGTMTPPEVAKICQGSDMFLLSSSAEGMPMALLEALACGLPAVATNVGEVKRVIRHSINGKLLNEPTPQSYAKAIAESLEHLSNYRSEASTDAVKFYTPKHVLAPVYERYRSLVNL